MSVDLNAELNAFRAMIVTLKDDIIRQRDAVSASSINTQYLPEPTVPYGHSLRAS